MKLGLIKQKIANFLNDESGASGIEYAIVAAMVAVTLVFFVPGISGAIEDIFGAIQTKLQAVDTTGA